VVAKYLYDSFGNTLGLRGSLAAGNTYRFSSKEIDARTGHYYYGYRWYDPNLQRWLNRDPIQEAGGLNLYGYVGNNPVNYVDPLGLLTDEQLEARASRHSNEFPQPPSPTDPLDVARGSLNSVAWNIFMPNLEAGGRGVGLGPKCNVFVGHCISSCPNRPNPMIQDPETGTMRYPTAQEWGDRNVNIPGYGPPHGNPQPGDVVTGGGHMGIMDTNGILEAPSHWYSGVTLWPLNNPVWNPQTGRTPIP